MEKREDMDLESFQFGEAEIQNLMSVVPQPETNSSFTALLELPPNHAVQLLHSPEEATPNLFSPVFSATGTENSAETMSSSPIHFNLMKHEPIESDSLHNSSPIVSIPVVPKSTKRKEREKKVKSSTKIAATDTDGEKLPYIHVRSRRGQATDSHSLAERARREKINAKMKLLQELVPGCSKISGTAMVLDEIINHVQALQRQVEFLSMRLAAVQPKIDVDLDTMFSAESGSLVDCNFTGMVSPSLWLNGNKQQYEQQLWNLDGLPQQPVWGREEDNPNMIAPEISLLSYVPSGNSDHVKMEI